MLKTVQRVRYACRNGIYRKFFTIELRTNGMFWYVLLHHPFGRKVLPWSYTNEAEAREQFNELCLLYRPD